MPNKILYFSEGIGVFIFGKNAYAHFSRILTGKWILFGDNRGDAFFVRWLRLAHFLFLEEKMDFLEKFKKMILVVGMVVVMLFALGILWISDFLFDDFDDWETQKETNLSEQKQDTDSTKQTNETKEKATETTFYSTNDRDTAKKGNSGVFAYSATTGKYESYYIIDFEEGEVYQFTDGSGYDPCYVAQIVEGDLNDVLIIKYHVHDEIWYEGLCFNWKRQPDTLIVQTEDWEEYQFHYTNLQEALEIMSEKNIIK